MATHTVVTLDNGMIVEGCAVRSIGHYSKEEADAAAFKDAVELHVMNMPKKRMSFLKGGDKLSPPFQFSGSNFIYALSYIIFLYSGSFIILSTCNRFDSAISGSTLNDNIFFDVLSTLAA